MILEVLLADIFALVEEHAYAEILLPRDGVIIRQLGDLEVPVYGWGVVLGCHAFFNVSLFFSSTEA